MMNERLIWSEPEEIESESCMTQRNMIHILIRGSLNILIMQGIVL
jgi:hypothetical protein